MNRTFHYLVEPQDSGLLLQDYLRRREGYSRRLIILLKRGGITVNGAHRRMVDRVLTGDVIEVTLPEAENRLIPNFSLDVPIVYEDEDLVIFDKPAGMTVHPCSLHYQDSLGNFFAAHYGNALVFRPTTRLDRDTTGLCLSAKNTLAAGKLIPTLEKEYFAIAEGIVFPESGTIDAPLIRVPGSIITRKVDPAGQRAVTHYQTVLTRNGDTLLSICLETGRTHQIRVHFSHLGYPLAGDSLYGGHTDRIARQALHCGVLRFVHPTTGAKMEISTQLPEDMKQLLE